MERKTINLTGRFVKGASEARKELKQYRKKLNQVRQEQEQIALIMEFHERIVKEDDAFIARARTAFAATKKQCVNITEEN